LKQGANVANDDFQSYFRGQQVSLQWVQVLRAMAQELSGTAEPEDLRRLFSKIGVRFAKDVEALFADVKTLKDLESELNDFWLRLNWGWVDLVEVKSGIDICHSAAPLAEAFGDDALAWSVGLLEGFYQNVFALLDASHGMAVFTLDDVPDPLKIHFRYGRKVN
jgi:hypothetical protein